MHGAYTAQQALPPEHIELDLVRALKAPATMYLRYQVVAVRGEPVEDRLEVVYLERQGMPMTVSRNSPSRTVRPSVSKPSPTKKAVTASRSPPGRRYLCLPARNRAMALSMRRCLVSALLAAAMLST
jgi:hypothetical protein